MLTLHAEVRGVRRAVDAFASGLRHAVIRTEIRRLYVAEDAQTDADEYGSDRSGNVVSYLIHYFVLTYLIMNIEHC